MDTHAPAPYHRQSNEHGGSLDRISQGAGVMNHRKTGFLVVAALAFSVVLTPAWGGEPTQADKATARALFDEGRTLVKAERYGEACMKLEESQKLDPGVGTMFNLADCYEHLGKSASAWSMYLEVAGLLSATGQKEREQAARERARALEPKLSRLTISVVPEASALQGLVVRRNHAELGRGTWGSAIPVDPGTHRVEAVAPGRKPWSRQVDVAGDAARVTVAIPLLEPEATPPPGPATQARQGPAAPAPIAAAPQHRNSLGTEPVSSHSQRTIGLVVAGAGVVGFGVGLGLAFSAKSKFNDSDPYCSGNKCSPQGVNLRDQAVSRAGTATIVSGIGLAAAVGGAVLFLLSPSGGEGRTTAGAMPVVAVGPGSVMMTGRF